MDMAKGVVHSESDYNPEEIQKEAEAILADPERKELFRVACTEPVKLACYPHGYNTMISDVRQGGKPIPLENVNTPTLIVHGDRDSRMNIKEANQAKEKIPNSELMIIQGGYHALALCAEGKASWARQCEFVKQHSA